MKQIKLVNKKAYYQYSILREYTAGIMLVGSEIKSILLNNVDFSDSYVYFKNSNELFLKNLSISKYKHSTWLNHEEKRDRKLLLNKYEINQISKLSKDNGITIIPLEIVEVNNKIKIKIGVAKGKKLFDKSKATKEKDIKRYTERYESSKY